MDESTDHTNRDDGTDDCTTTASFDDHGIDDGSELIRRTYYRLVADGWDSFEPTERFLDRLADAFTRSYLTATDAYELPPHVAAAVDDARAWAGVEFADEPDADLRGTVLPAFYRHAAGFHCAYRD
ncbi:hypothetical protein DJ82_07615 [Halorubrum sp. Ib24]|uniref:hypothetical protein n=1 Tax=Halorubrum sp. Ib24 TaxID=1383850 RepID=UPI000B98AA8A|nr:hypothetical protein [Halorubrum sp. Ib24]OYR40595.1 hypothetical protein DJ82_07615 [Halorubrum sp. Ib24]